LLRFTTNGSCPVEQPFYLLEDETVVAPSWVGVVAGLVAEDVLQKFRSHPKIRYDSEEKPSKKFIKVSQNSV
jgi:hypothetical protein